MSTPYTIRIGQRLTDYSNIDVTVERVATGGMGLVAFGTNQLPGAFRVGVMYALKTIKPEALAANPDLRERFIREGLTWRGLWPHPNILTMQFVTEIDGLPFLMLDYAEHGSLADFLAYGRLPLASALGIAQDIAAGLSALHTPDPAYLRPDPLVHRDLKPDNVLIRQLGEGQYSQITDFGLVAVLPQVRDVPMKDNELPLDATRSARFHTRQGSVLGTAAYMAPEQWGGREPVGPPVDLYALGLILAQCVTGMHPLLALHQRHSVGQWRTAHAQGTPQRLQAVVPEAPVPLERLYLSLLAKRAADRPTAVETLAALNAVAQRLSLPEYAPHEVVVHTAEHERIWWQGWADAYTNFGLWDEALARNDRALQLAPHHPFVLLNQGTILLGMQRWAEALACYQDSLQECTAEDHIGRSSVYNQIGNLHMQQEAYRAAETAYVQALGETPESAAIWFNRANNERLWGLAEVQAGQQGAARAHLQRAHEHVQQALTLSPHATNTPRLLVAIEKAVRQIG